MASALPSTVVDTRASRALTQVSEVPVGEIPPKAPRPRAAETLEKSVKAPFIIIPCQKYFLTCDPSLLALRGVLVVAKMSELAP